MAPNYYVNSGSTASTVVQGGPTASFVDAVRVWYEVIALGRTLAFEAGGQIRDAYTGLPILPLPDVGPPAPVKVYRRSYSDRTRIYPWPDEPPAPRVPPKATPDAARAPPPVI